MADAVGLSHLYPAVPIMNFLAMISLPLLIPGFWKTRIVALVAVVGWIFLGNLLSFIGTIRWRGNTNHVPVLADILSILRRTWLCGYFTSMACFAHFTWQRLQPLSVRQLYDTRRRNNLIHVFLALILPLLSAPLLLVSCPYRYVIYEDFGPSTSIRRDWPGLVVSRLPTILSCVTVGIFSTLALVDYWRMKREDIDSDIPKHHSSVRTRKLLLMAVINIPLALYGVYRQIVFLTIDEWVAPTSLAENIASLQVVLLSSRSDLETTSKHDAAAAARTAIFTPLLGFYLFAWFGLGAEARKAYGEALLELGRLIGVTHREHWPHVGTLPFSCLPIALRTAKLQQGFADALPVVLPNAPQITPFISTVPPDGDPQVPASPTRIQSSGPVGNKIDIKRQERVLPRESTRRLSSHKPPLATLNPVNAIQSASDVPQRRLSHHKPPFVALAPPNIPAIGIPDASGSTPPRVEVANNIRRQERFASRPRARRLSYHKPAFIPLAPANANSAVPSVLGPTILPVEIPGFIIGERNAGLPAGSVLGGSVIPPPLSSPTTTAPPPLSTPSTATPAPPYREVNAFLDDAP